MEVLSKRQKASDKFWTDEAGVQIPVSRITPLEKFKENEAFALLKQAITLHNGLVAYKRAIAEACRKIKEMAEEANGMTGKGRGNYTWYSFDRSIKIEARMGSSRRFDDLIMMAVQEKLDACLVHEKSGSSDFLTVVINNCFSKSNGKLDVEKVLEMRKYKSRTNNALFDEALDLADKAIQITYSKLYYSIYQRLEDNSYELVNIDFASLEAWANDFRNN